MLFCLPEVRSIQRSEAELNIPLPWVNNFDIKQKMAWSICFIIYPKAPNKKWMNVNKASYKAQNILVTNHNHLKKEFHRNNSLFAVIIFFFVKSLNHYELLANQ